MKPRCPYCNSEQEIDHNDGYGYDEGELHNQECSDCGKSFAYETAIIFHYTTYPADCLNGGEHKYLPIPTIPKEFTKMRCSECGDIRSMTDDERRENGIGTVHDYINSLR